MILTAGLLAAAWTSSKGQEQGRTEELLAHPFSGDKAFTSTLSFQKICFEERQCQGNLCVIQAWPSLLPGAETTHSEHEWGTVVYPCWGHLLSASRQRLDSPY